MGHPWLLLAETLPRQLTRVQFMPLEEAQHFGVGTAYSLWSASTPSLPTGQPSNPWLSLRNKRSALITSSLEQALFSAVAIPVRAQASKRPHPASVVRVLR